MVQTKSKYSEKQNVLNAFGGSRAGSEDENLLQVRSQVVESTLHAQGAAAQGCVQVQFTAGTWAYEVSWKILGAGGSCSSVSYQENNRQYDAEECCVEPGKYTLKCEDSYGDGWNGGKLTIDGGEAYCDNFNGRLKEVEITIPGFAAKVPVKFIVVTKKEDGKVVGHVPKGDLGSKLAVVNTIFRGANPSQGPPVDAASILAGDNCLLKCSAGLCWPENFRKQIPKEVIDNCYCAIDFCTDPENAGIVAPTPPLTSVLGPMTNTGIQFELESVTYVENAEYHDQCCCHNAGGLSYEPVQIKMFDDLVNKSAVRTSVTVFLCNMLVAGSLGQSNIVGSEDCYGGPGIMLNTDATAKNLAHELGHSFGLYHTFNEYCPEQGGSCKKEDVCNPEKNKGDRVDDTPLYKKQGRCATGLDSCPGVEGQDPIDNIMSYSDCEYLRFTPGQAGRMQKAIADYYPAFITAGPGKGNSPKDLPCDPKFPNGVVPDGYTAKPAPAPSPGPSPTPVHSQCNLEPGQCDTYDAQGCACSDASICCDGYGCAGTPLFKQCLPCSWTPDNMTPDSCKGQSLAQISESENDILEALRTSDTARRSGLFSEMRHLFHDRDGI